jgi:hypothetical protein
MLRCAPRSRRRVFEIDRRITVAPEEAGESRTLNQRIIFTPPLAAVFEVFVDDRRALVTHVRQFGSNRP